MAALYISPMLDASYLNFKPMKVEDNIMPILWMRKLRLTKAK